MKKETNTYLLIGEIVLIVAVVASLSYFAYSFFKKRREAKETEATGEIAKQLDVNSNTTLLSKNKKEKEKQYEEAKKMDITKVVDLIYNAKKTFKGDDEQSVYSAFSLIPNLFALSFVKNGFEKLYKKDLFVYLNSFLDESELKKVNDIVKKLK